MINKNVINKALSLLGSILKEKHQRISIVICGGAALILSNLTSKNVTKDIDILGILGIIEDKESTKTEIKYAKPLPKFLQEIIKEIAEVMKLPEIWLNSGPSDLVKLDLPEGLIERLLKKEYGDNLNIYIIHRIDQIHFKLYAAVDTGPGRHFDDLMELNPSEEEIIIATRWVITQDPSEGFREILVDMLEKMGYGKAINKI
jgi:hypothetical protein